MAYATLLEAYTAERAPVANAFHVWQAPACHALRTARTKLDWEAAGGDVVDEWEARNDYPRGRVRLLLRADDDPSSALDGDFTERQLKELRERANRDGVCGICGQYWDGADWVDVDSVWGFIGNDWHNSGYDVDIMRATLDALAEHDAAKAAAMEAERPDLYPA